MLKNFHYIIDVKVQCNLTNNPTNLSPYNQTDCPAASGWSSSLVFRRREDIGGDTGDTEGVTVDCKCKPFVDIRWSSRCVSEPNQQNQQHYCLPSPPPLHCLPQTAWAQPNLSVAQPGHLADFALWMWANRNTNLGTWVTSAALITPRYLCRGAAPSAPKCTVALSFVQQIYPDPINKTGPALSSLSLLSARLEFRFWK